MNPERYNRVDELFQQALSQPTEKLRSFLEEACAGDAALRHEVESLLEHDRRAVGFIDSAVPHSVTGWVGEGHPDLMGCTLLHYRIMEKIGEGGMGVVYRAEDRHLKRSVALKLLPPDKMTDPERKGRFIHEARAASALNHPNIVTIHDISSADGIDFIAMEYVPGSSLAQLIGDKGLSLQETLKYAIQIADALEKAHRAGIVHRDLKPSNIVVTEDGLVKILDFGLAKLTHPAQQEVSVSARSSEFLSDSGIIVGTAAYMSPEQAEGKAVDGRSDIFSFGAMLYEMITGRRAFRGESIVSTLAAVLHAEPEPLSRVVDGMPSELGRIIGKALQKDRGLRYQSASDLAADLRCLHRNSESGRAVAETSGFRRGKRWMAVLAAVTSVLLALALFLLNVGSWRDWLLGRASLPEIQSLAVLPLASLSGDSEQDYFADGMTDALISDLGEIAALRVISRTSVMQYKGSRKSLRDIARELNVDAVIEGSVLRSGSRVRITAQLIRADTERRIWGGTFERDLRDILILQGDLAREIAAGIRVKLIQQHKGQLSTSRSVIPEAYDAYLQGRYHFRKWTGDGIKQSIKFFELAIASDPSYALAYVGLAGSYDNLAAFAPVIPQEAFPRAKEAARKALELDETLAEAHGPLAFAMAVYDWDWSGAENEYRRALELNPNSASNHSDLGFFLAWLGRFEEALTEVRRARELDPLSLGFIRNFGAVLYLGRQYDRAISEWRKALAIDPDWLMANLDLGRAFSAKGMHTEAIAQFQRAFELPGANKGGVANDEAWLGNAYALAGRKQEALGIINTLQQRSRQQYVAPISFAMIYAGLGEKNEAFRWLERAYRERCVDMNLLKVLPVWDPLRSDPRFQSLLRRVNFPR
jgi:TolB-like protein/Tfp pilus assembly protein PilF/predicted Ser/Thr protein kinase